MNKVQLGNYVNKVHGGILPSCSPAVCYEGTYHFLKPEVQHGVRFVQNQKLHEFKCYFASEAELINAARRAHSHIYLPLIYLVNLQTTKVRMFVS